MLRTAFVSAALAVALAGCASAPTKPAPFSRPYPALAQQETLDIQVYRVGTRIEVTNSSASVLGPGTLWLNMWFSHPFEAVNPGETVTMPLSAFKDQYGDSFRAGGFWSTEPPDRLALAQLELPEGDSSRLVGLVVVGNASGK